jgi:hypothetical protein
MSLFVQNLFLGLACLLAGCHQPTITPGSLTESLKLVLQDIQRVDVDPDHYPSYPDYHARVYQQTQDIVRHVASAAELKSLFVECTRRWRAAPDRPQEQLKWIDPYCTVRDAILFRLAELDSEEATKILVDLYSNDTLSWGGESGLNGGNAISRCGRRALSHLKSTDFGARKAVVRQIVACIEKGELYGP